MPADSPEHRQSRDDFSIAWVTLLIVLTTVAYLPCLRGDFVLDDDLLLTENAMIRAPDGLYRMWLTTEPEDYWPLSATTFWVEWRLWGSNPTGYHVTNLVLHIVSALLVWAILRRLQIPGARLAALLFAVHPVNVESVAWIAQRKDTLALVLFLLSIYWFLKSQITEKKAGVSTPWFVLSMAAFVLAMLSKSSVVVLPFLLLLIVWWRRGLSWWDGVRVLPYLAVAVVLVLVHLHVQGTLSAEPIRDATFADRLVGAGAAIFFYLYKALVPIHLLFIYPMWSLDAHNLLWWLPLAAAVAITALLWWYRDGWGRPLLFAWCWFCISLLPVMGFVDVGFMRHSLVADHYQHIAIIAVVALVAAAVTKWGQRVQLPTGRTVIAEGVVLVSLLTLFTLRQSELYASPLSLYTATLEGNPDSRAAHNNLGVALVEHGHFYEAIAHHEAALRIDPSFTQTRINLAVALSSAGRLDDAILQYKTALQNDPSHALAHHNLAAALAQTGRREEAIAEYKAALAIKPLLATHMNLGGMLANAGRLDEAVAQFRAALEMSPSNPVIHDALANALAASGQTDEAITHYQEALRLNPANAEVKRKLASLQSGKREKGDAAH